MDLKNVFITTASICALTATSMADEGLPNSCPVDWLTNCGSGFAQGVESESGFQESYGEVISIDAGESFGVKFGDLGRTFGEDVESKMWIVSVRPVESNGENVSTEVYTYEKLVFEGEGVATEESRVISEAVRKLGSRIRTKVSGDYGYLLITNPTSETQSYRVRVRAR